MTTRTTLPGTPTDGTTWTETDINSLPGGWVGHAFINAAQGSVGTAETDVVGLSVTVTVPASRTLRLSAQLGLADGTGSPNVAAFYITDGSNTHQGAGFQVLVPASDVSYGSAFTLATPPAGTITYKVRGNFTAGASNQFMASGSNLGWILVEDVGPV